MYFELIVEMSKQYKNLNCRTSRSSRDNRDRKKSNVKCCISEPKTPPLPIRHESSIDELMKQRESLKTKLKNISRHDVKNDDYKNKANRKKRKQEVKSVNNPKKKTYGNDKQKDKTHQIKIVDSSPECIEDLTQLDSEDEEHLIEQRRKQRKELLEQFYKSDVDTEDHSKNESSKIYNIECSNSPSNSKNSVISTASVKKVTDMFSDEDFQSSRQSDQPAKGSKNNVLSTDDWDDSEGYYKINIGDVMNNRYTIKDLFGKGVFANVVKAQDNSKGNINVAIKIIRNNDLMYKTGLKEIAIIKEINDADPENKYHCVRMQSHFMHRGHLCLVLECLHMDLRAVLKKYGRHHGIHMKALTSYSRQLLLALKHLKKVGIVHADIKPDNILVNEKKNLLKLCDFGSAASTGDREPTPYLVSRFYRAPEIILGVPYTHSIDLWSTACSIYEMATGKILFIGSSNNKMLKCFMDLKGKIPNKLLRKGKFKDQHFNYNNNFLLHKKDEFTGREKFLEVSNINIVRDLNKDLQKSYKNSLLDEEKKISQLKDLLEKMLMLDPSQRLPINDCLKHAFIQEI